eukprot:6452046-Pyramimonas_sp.AAC.1
MPGAGEVTLEQTRKQWFGAAEDRLAQIHGMHGKEAQGYTGRACGPRTQKVPLGTLWDKDQRRRLSSATTT